MIIFKKNRDNKYYWVTEGGQAQKEVPIVAIESQVEDKKIRKESSMMKNHKFGSVWKTPCGCYLTEPGV